MTYILWFSSNGFLRGELEVATMLGKVLRFSINIVVILHKSKLAPTNFGVAESVASCFDRVLAMFSILHS